MNIENIPQKDIPKHLYDEFTMNGVIPVQYSYYDNRISSPIHICASCYPKAFLELEKKIFSYYGNQVNSFYDAFIDYDIKGKNILIYGLVGYNCEAIALWKGAKSVYVVDYNKPICEHERVHVITHDELKNLPIKFDYAISFSSFEHDGLGRYGDPICPWADIKTMQNAKKIVSDSGILFLAVPTGRDMLVWNAHRIYGEKRLPLLLSGWLPLDIYSTYCGQDIFKEPLAVFDQPLIALKNMTNADGEREKIIERLHHAKNMMKQTHLGTRDGKMLVQVLEMKLQLISSGMSKEI